MMTSTQDLAPFFNLSFRYVSLQVPFWNHLDSFSLFHLFRNPNISGYITSVVYKIMSLQEKDYVFKINDSI